MKTKLNLGCGDLLFDDCINYDLYNPKADVRGDVRKLPFASEVMDKVIAIHLIEHFNFQEIWGVLYEWVRVLKRGGTLTVETPDLLACCKDFVETKKYDRMIGLYSQFYGMPRIEGQGHKFLFTEEQLRWTLECVGLKDIERLPALRFPGGEDVNMKLVGIK